MAMARSSITRSTCTEAASGIPASTITKIFRCWSQAALRRASRAAGIFGLRRERIWPTFTSRCSIAWVCIWILSWTAPDKSKISSLFKEPGMHWRTIGGLAVVGFGLAASAIAAAPSALADAMEQRDQAGVRALL